MNRETHSKNRQTDRKKLGRGAAIRWCIYLVLLRLRLRLQRRRPPLPGHPARPEPIPHVPQHPPLLSEQLVVDLASCSFNRYQLLGWRCGQQGGSAEPARGNHATLSPYPYHTHARTPYLHPPPPHPHTTTTLPPFTASPFVPRLARCESPQSCKIPAYRRVLILAVSAKLAI